MSNIKHIAAYSGGHSSALVAIEVCRKFGKENVVLLNSATQNPTKKPESGCIQMALAR